jgi:hypothetical protein
MAYTTIDDPSAYFQATTYSGTGSTASVTNGGNSDLQPDWVWIKARNATRDHRLMDSTRGVQKELVSNGTAAEYTEATGFTAFQSDGFQHGGANGYGASGENYVAWQWKANGGTTTAGGGDDTIATSTHQANTTAGFSIVTYTGEEANKTVKHGLSTALDMLLVKNRDTAKDWRMWFKGFSGTERLQLNDTSAKATTNTSWNGTVPSSSVFSLGDDTNTNTDGDKFVAYCFHSVQGYSKFGSYTGNGNTDGPFVYTGFKPAWVMVKETSGTGQWRMRDNKRSTVNPVGVVLYANGTNAEATEDNVDFLSNGFKVRTSGGENNGNGDTYVYMAFAEHPFVSSQGVPVTAK